MMRVRFVMSSYSETNTPFWLFFSSQAASEVDILITFHKEQRHQNYMKTHSALFEKNPAHYNDVIVSAMASQIAGVSIVCLTVRPGIDQGKHQSSASLAFVRESTGHRWIPLAKVSNAENVSIWWRHHFPNNSDSITAYGFASFRLCDCMWQNLAFMCNRSCKFLSLSEEERRQNLNKLNSIHQFVRTHWPRTKYKKKHPRLTLSKRCFPQEHWFHQISLKFVPKVKIDNNPALIKIMAWRQAIISTNSDKIHWRIYASLRVKPKKNPRGCWNNFCSQIGQILSPMIFF